MHRRAEKNHLDGNDLLWLQNANCFRMHDSLRNKHLLYLMSLVLNILYCHSNESIYMNICRRSYQKANFLLRAKKINFYFHQFPFWECRIKQYVFPFRTKYFFFFYPLSCGKKKNQELTSGDFLISTFHLLRTRPLQNLLVL